MAIKYISYHWAVGGVRRLNTNTGRSHRSWKHSWEDAPDKGWAIRLGFKWFYHYEHENQWFFQHKARLFQKTKSIIPIGEDHHFSIGRVGKRHRKLTIKQGSDVVFQVTYKFKGYWTSRFDPTYDIWDAEADDPFLNFIDWDENWENTS